MKNFIITIALMILFIMLNHFQINFNQKIWKDFMSEGETGDCYVSSISSN